jgi:hypothetical protein
MKFSSSDGLKTIVSKGEETLFVIDIKENEEYQIPLSNYISWNKSENC